MPVSVRILGLHIPVAALRAGVQLALDNCILDMNLTVTLLFNKGKSIKKGNSISECSAGGTVIQRAGPKFHPQDNPP